MESARYFRERCKRYQKIMVNMEMILINALANKI